MRLRNEDKHVPTKVSTSLHQSTWYHIPEDSDPNILDDRTTLPRSCIIRVSKPTSSDMPVITI
jgi:hypothetical protein